MRIVIGILWPSFLVAGVAEMVFFSLFDPTELHFLGEPIDVDRTTIYSLGFFAFWLFGAVSSALTQWLARASVVEASR